VRARDGAFRLLLQVPQLRQLDGVLLKKNRLRIGKVLLGTRPAIALTITDLESPQALLKAKRLGAGLLEVRIDRFRRLDERQILQRIHSLKRVGLPLIATIRSQKEGGRRFLSESQRVELFKKILPKVDAIDLELASKHLCQALIPLAHRKGKRVILSYHNFRTTPADSTLEDFIQRAQRRGADIVKIAVTPKKNSDTARLLLLTQRNRGKNLISIAMGPRGAPSRILAPLFGSLVTYSYIGRPPSGPYGPKGRRQAPFRDL